MSIKIYVKYVKNNRDFHATKLNLPTGNLDSKTELEVISMLKSCVSEYGQTLVMITHDETIAQMADRMIVIEDGKVVRA